MGCLSLGEIKISVSGQPLDYFALFVAQFGPGFQPSFFTSRTGRLKYFFHDALSCLLANFSRVS
jgi:hypothetical protein